MILGYGEIGKALHHVLKQSFDKQYIYVRDVDKQTPFKVDYLHICYPYNSSEWVSLTKEYQAQYEPELTLVHTTTIVGATKKIKDYKVHCPIRGRHSDLSLGIESYPMIVGHDDSESLSRAMEYLSQWAHRPSPRFPSESTELAKLLSLTQYAYNIEFWRYAKRCCDRFSVDFGDIKDYTQTYNEVITRLEGINFHKTILDAPEGAIGGHCVIPAVTKLNEQVPDETLKAILEIDKKLR